MTSELPTETVEHVAELVLASGDGKSEEEVIIGYTTEHCLDYFLRTCFSLTTKKSENQSQPL